MIFSRFTNMILLRIVLIYCNLFLVLNYSNAGDTDSQDSFLVYHSLDLDPVPVYEQIGVITLYSIRSGSAEFFQNKPLSSDNIAKLKKLAEADGIYRIKVVDNSNNPTNPVSVFSFTKACAIYYSKLNEEITLTLDQSGRLVGVAVSAVPPHCTVDSIPDINVHTFNTSVILVNLATGPAPDTMTYIQRLEQEKAEKARGEQGDNRSFFAKYWMYIIPLVIFLFIGVSGPEGQAGGR